MSGTRASGECCSGGSPRSESNGAGARARRERQRRHWRRRGDSVARSQQTQQSEQDPRSGGGGGGGESAKENSSEQTGAFDMMIASGASGSGASEPRGGRAAPGERECSARDCPRAEGECTAADCCCFCCRWWCWRCFGGQQTVRTRRKSAKRKRRRKDTSPSGEDENRPRHRTGLSSRRSRLVAAANETATQSLIVSAAVSDDGKSKKFYVSLGQLSRSPLLLLALSLSLLLLAGVCYGRECRARDRAGEQVTASWAELSETSKGATGDADPFRGCDTQAPGARTRARLAGDGYGYGVVAEDRHTTTGKQIARAERAGSGGLWANCKFAPPSRSLIVLRSQLSAHVAHICSSSAKVGQSDRK